MNDIGFLGLGSIGRPMAERLVGGGHKLVVFDVRPAAIEPLTALGAHPAAGVGDLLDRCEVIVVSLPTPGVVRDVLLHSGEFRSGRRVRIVVNNSTIGAMLAGEVSSALSQQGIALVDCPISGGPASARSGSLSVMVSGDAGAIDAVRPLFWLWGSTVTVVGKEPGAAQVLKLANNMLTAVSIVATSEALVMGAKAGLDPRVMIDAINASSGRNGATLALFPQFVLGRTFDFGSPIDMLMKDVDLAIEQGEALGIPMWVSQAARLVGKHAQFAGRGGDDVTTLVNVVEAGAEFEMPKAIPIAKNGS